MNEAGIEQFCRVLLEQSEVADSLRDAASSLLEGPIDWKKSLELAYVLYRSVVYRGCLTFLSNLDGETSDEQGARKILQGVCYFCTGDKSASDEKFADLEGVEPAGEFVSKTLDEIYQSANLAFNRGEIDDARGLYNCVLPFDTRLHGVNKGTLGFGQGLAESMDNEVDALAERLRSVASQKDVLEEEQPSIAQSLKNISEADVESLKGRRLLLVLREKIHKDSKIRKDQTQRNFRITAEAVGLDVHFFSADPFIHYWVHEDEVRVRALRDLAKVISEVKPDFVVFDCLCAHVADTVLTPTIYAATMNKLKIVFNFKLIAFYPDAYEEQCTWAANFVSGFVDSVWCLSHLAYLKFEKDTQAKTAVIPFPHVHTPSETCSERTIDAAFIGTSKRYNFLRSLWFLAMEEAEIPFELILTDPAKKPNRLTLTDEEYAGFLGRIKCCIQFSARDVDTKILCGRVWESMWAGCVLLEEENIETKQLLVPYRHYIPFNSIRELAVAVACMNRYPDECERLASEGEVWVRELLSPDKIWAHILLRA